MATTRKSASASKSTNTRKSTETRKTAGTREGAATRKTAGTSRTAGTSDGAAPRKKAVQSRPRRTTAMEAARSAAEQLAELTGREPECVVGIESVDHDGWHVDLEVVESRRIPDSTDVLAIYQVHVDEAGDLLGYRRERRYIRGRGGDGGEGGGR